jgi:hypothetical protein
MKHIETTWPRGAARPILDRIIREHGDAIGKADNAIEALSIFNGAWKMSIENAAAAPAKKAASKKGTKNVKKAAKKEVEATAPRGSVIGGLYDLLKKAGAKHGLSAAKKLASGTELSKKELIELRDNVNAAAEAAREAGKGSLSSNLSAANRSVRRMARSA